MKIRTGSYTGNSNAGGQAITGIGFQPSLVIVKRDNNADVGVIRTSSMPANNGKPFTGSNAISTTAVVKSLDSDGFTLSNSNSRINQSATNYWYLAIGQEDANFAVGSYTGNGTDNRDITIGGSFSGTPDMVWIFPESANRPNWRSSDFSGDNSMPMNQAIAANKIQAFGSGTFQVGTNAEVNTNGTVYHYVAFKKVTGAFNTFTYTGNNTDNRSLTGFGFQPSFAITQRTDASSAIARIDSVHSGDESIAIDGTAADAANQIQNFLSDGIELGTSITVNASLITYFGFAFASSVFASGADRLSQLTASGSAENIQTATGSPSLSSLTAQGDALEIVDPILITGEPTLSQLTASGSGIYGGFASGNPTLPQIVADADSLSGPYASGNVTLRQLQSRAESSSASPIEITDDSAIITEWIMPASVAVYPHVFTAPVQVTEWILSQSSFPQYRNISILHLPSYGIFMHSPFFPYKRIRDITHLVSNIDRNYSRMEPGHASFTIPQMPSSDHSVHEGNIVVIQTSDQPVWAGPIYTDETQLGTGVTQVHALDMGSLLARRNVEQTEHYTTAIGSGAVVRSFINKMNARGSTGIIIGRIDPGPTIYDFEAGSQSVLDGLNELHDRTDWEWWIENEATPHKLVSRFYWGRRQGVDYSRTAHFWYGVHFADGSLTHDLSEGKQVSIVVGGGFSKIWKRNSASASAITGQKVNWQSILNQLTPELNVRTNNQLPAALRDERQRVDVMTENSAELIRSAERDAVRKLYAETTLQVTLVGDRSKLQVGNYVSIHAPLGQHGELDGAVRLVEVQPDDELGQTLCTMEVRL